MGAEVDCELFGTGLLGQPVNTLTTIAFVVGGAILVGRRAVRWVGIGLIATGVGSFLFHGPVTPGAQWAHDVSLAWLILLVAGVGRSWEHLTRIPGLTAIGIVLWVVPGVADVLAVLLTLATIALLLQRDRSLRTIGPMALLASSAIIGRLGATGGPLCDPTSLLQPHGFWHVAAAAAITWWGLAFRSQ